MEIFDIPATAEKAISQLNAYGYEAWLVGGCVRDLLMDSTPNDWDITTAAEPAEIKRVFSNFKLIETGLKHGTVTVLIEGKPIEITTFRMDGEYSDHRRPDSVFFTKSLKEDLARRDFTMNAIACSPRGGTKIADYFDGITDINLGIIRCVGEPNRRFHEDGLRILRALRFSSVLGFAIADETSRAIHENKGLLKHISPERICVELTKMLDGKNIGAVLIRYPDVLCEVMPELLPMIGFEQNNEHHRFDVWNHSVAVVESIPPESILRWAALLHDVGKPPCFSMGKDGQRHFYGHSAAGRDMADVIMRRLRFDNATRERILLLIAHHDTPIPTEEKTVKRYLNRFGEEVLNQLISLARADNLGQAEAFRHRQDSYDALERTVKKVIDQRSCFSLKDLDINGDDLMELGYRGREIGSALSFLLNAVMDEKVLNKNVELRGYLTEWNLL